MMSPQAKRTAELASDLEVMTRLHQLSTRHIQAGELNILLAEILDTALDLTRSDKGYIQLLQDGVPRIMEHRGFDAAFIGSFERAERVDSASGAAFTGGERVIVPDVEASPILAGTAALRTMLEAGVRAVQSTPIVSRSGRTLGMLSTHYGKPQRPGERDLRVLDLLARQAAEVIERSEAEQTLRESGQWQAGQKEAFQAAVNGSSLEVSLGILTRTAVRHFNGEARCAFYIADGKGTELRHVVGMPDDYARCVEGFEVSSKSLACGLAVHRGQPEITPDVCKEPLWKDWLWLAKQFDYRACWSFPVETSTGKTVGSFALYFRKPRDAGSKDRAFAASMTHAASIIISQAQEAEERRQAEEALRTSERQLAEELAATQRIQEISIRLIAEDKAELLYEYLLDAAVAIMHSDFASMQMLYPERGEHGELRLLAFAGFNAAAAKLWEWVSFDSESTSCGTALRTGARVIVPDVETCVSMAGTEDLAMFRDTGIRAMQSTPLLSRSGAVVGMISTHWNRPHQPSERELRLFDIVARQAADLIEHKRAKDQLDQEVAGLRTLHEVGTRLLEARDVRSLLKETLAAAGAITGTDTGTLQLVDPSTGALKIEAHRGLPSEFIEFFNRIEKDDVTPCATALARGVQVCVEDVEKDLLFAGTRALEVERAAGIRSVQSTPIRSRNGQPIGMLSTHYRNPRPFSERDLRLLDLLARQAADLIERARSEEKLRQTNAELSRANDDLSHFAFAASHDLQEPLRMITSYSQLLVRGYRGQLDGEAGTAIGYITEGAKRMRGLLTDLLAYTRLTGEPEEAATLVDLNVAFRTAVENLKAAVEDTDALVTSDPLPAAFGYQPQFVQLFQNLISNGLKYSGELAPRIHVSSERKNGFWRIGVRDHGIGIAPQYQEQIFGAFKRLHGQDIPGSGMGLAICQRVVERGGGRIWVESRTGQGATFYFTLPAAGDLKRE